jgi:hypothetical protein
LSIDILSAFLPTLIVLATFHVLYFSPFCIWRLGMFDWLGWVEVCLQEQWYCVVPYLWHDKKWDRSHFLSLVATLHKITVRVNRPLGLQSTECRSTNWRRAKSSWSQSYDRELQRQRCKILHRHR